jgi:hypothetical protein
MVGKIGTAYRRGGHVMNQSVGYERTRGAGIDIGESEEVWRRICVDGGIFHQSLDGQRHRLTQTGRLWQSSWFGVGNTFEKTNLWE